MFNHFLPLETPKYLASKWIHLPFLVDTQDWKRFFALVEKLVMVRSSGVYLEQEIILTQQAFLENWDRYLQDLSSTAILDSVYKPLFSLFCSQDLETIGLVDVGDGRVTATQLAPNIIFQAHRFQYSDFDKQFRRQVFGPGTISWGIQASFPTLFQHPKTRAVQKVLLHPEVINRPLWMIFQKWLKETTIPVTFETAHGVKTVPFRIAKGCIDRHFELERRGIRIV